MRHQRSDHPLAARGDPPGRRARRILAVLSAAASLSLLLPTTAYAEPAADAEATTHPVVASYASDYSVTIIEAQRRLERIPQLQQVLASLHEIEADRLAGWGIDHHGKMTAWVWLNGDEAPRPQASALADAHADVEIRTGAAFTFAELVAAQNRFGFGEAVGAIGNTGATDGGQRLFSDVITHTGIDLSANALEIGVHAEYSRASVSFPRCRGPRPGRARRGDRYRQQRLNDARLRGDTARGTHQRFVLRRRIRTSRIGGCL